jgi:hypothetical protein
MLKICEHCNIEFNARRSKIRFCSHRCGRQNSIVRIKETKICPKCNKEFSQKDNQQNRDYLKQIYCSQRCAVQSLPKKQPQGKCYDCQAPIRSGWKRCTTCHSKLYPDPRPLTLKEIKDRYTTLGDKYGVNWRRVISAYAKRILDIPSSCQVCNYEKHVQICHIKSKTSFPDTATIGEINSPDNVVFLCPNCHWELDHGLLERDSFLKVL